VTGERVAKYALNQASEGGKYRLSYLFEGFKRLFTQIWIFMLVLQITNVVIAELFADLKSVLAWFETVCYLINIFSCLVEYPSFSLQNQLFFVKVYQLQIFVFLGKQSVLEIFLSEAIDSVHKLSVVLLEFLNQVFMPVRSIVGPRKAIKVLVCNHLVFNNICYIFQFKHLFPDFFNR